MKEIIFEVEEANEGGYIAQAVGESIFVKGKNLDDLRANIYDAINCHFEEDQRPEFLELQIKDYSLTDEQKAELERGLEDYRKNPSQGIPWEEVLANMNRRHGLID